MIVSGSYDKTARVFSVTTGKQVACVEEHRAFVLSALFSRDGSKVITGSVLGDVRVTDVASGQQVAQIQAHTGPITCLALSSDGALLATAGGDKAANVWDTATEPWTRIASLRHADSVQAVGFSPDDLLLATSGTDTLVKVFEVSRRRKEWAELARINGHSDEVNSVAFAAPAAARLQVLLATGADDRSVCVWDMTPVLVALKVSQAKEKKGPRSVPLEPIAGHHSPVCHPIDVCSPSAPTPAPAHRSGTQCVSRPAVSAPETCALVLRACLELCPTSSPSRPYSPLRARLVEYPSSSSSLAYRRRDRPSRVRRRRRSHSPLGRSGGGAGSSASGGSVGDVTDMDGID
jgi:WD40 repeat protein